MATQKKVAKAEQSVEVQEITREEITFCVLGLTPLICNSMSEKALHEFLLPAGKKTASEKKSSMKHDPYAEYNGSIYRLRDDQPTLIAMLATSFKNSLRGAAIDIPGKVTKAQMGRLMFVTGPYIPVYGNPEMLMSVVRTADQARTPDVRTRAILPEWAAYVTVTYIKPMLTQKSVINLMGAAGIIQGLGEWRPEKGKGDFGQYSLVSQDNKTFQRIIKDGGREAQIAGMAAAKTYDEETEKLLRWFDSETESRGLKHAGALQSVG